MKVAEENRKTLLKNNKQFFIPKIMKKNKFILLLFAFILFTTSCEFFQKEDENKIEIPKGITQAQLQEARYKFKRDKSYQQKYLYQNKTDSAIITIYNVVDYQIKDNETNIGEGYRYYIFDISVDNPTNHNFNIGAFSKSCYLTNNNPIYSYSNVGFALKMYYLQSDSSDLDMEFIKRFYLDTMPAKEFLRAKLFAFEVSLKDKDPLFFHYKIGNQTFEFKVRDEVY